MNKMYGWAGNVLYVDLADKTVVVKPTSDYAPEKYIGGMGLASKIFWDMGCPKVTAFDSQNPLIISVGPLTGLPGPFNRAIVCSISPHTYPDELFTYSSFGGKFSSEMKYAGYDSIVVTGKAKIPVVISINDGDVQIKDADNLWGLDLLETQRVLTADDPKATILTIGPAGENKSRIAVIANESGSTAGQGGFGAVMGAKNLKAISIKGTKSVRIANPEEFQSILSYLHKKGDWDKGGFQIAGRVPLCGQKTEEDFKKKYRKKFGGPYGCPLQCMAFYDVPGIGKQNAMCASFWYCWFSQDTEATWEALHLSQKLGINHYELHGLTLFIADTLRQGVMTASDWEDAGLIDLPANIGGTGYVEEMKGGTNSDMAFVKKLVKAIADGSSIFSNGVARAMKKILEKRKDSEGLKERFEIMFPAWGQYRHFYGWLGLALGVAVDTRDVGASTEDYIVFCREEDHDIPLDVLGKHFNVPYGLTAYSHPPDSEIEAVYEGIEKQVDWVQRNMSLKNSLLMCNFSAQPNFFFHPPEMDIRILESQLFSSVTGVEMNPDSLWEAGERIYNLRRAIMVKREDRSREKDTFTDSFFDKTFDDVQYGHYGEISYPTYIDRKKFEELKDRFYKLKGWDVETGRPKRDKLEELDMEDVADELEKIEKLPKIR